MTTLNDLLEADFEQSKEMESRFGGKDSSLIQQQASKGICYALCAKWISRHMKFKSEGSQKRVAYLKQEGVMVDAMQAQIFSQQNRIALELMSVEIAQKSEQAQKGIPLPKGYASEIKTLQSRMGGDRKNEMMTQAYALEGLTRTPTTVIDAALSSTVLSDRVNDIFVKSSSVHTYHQLGFTGPGKGHAVCCYMSGGNIISSGHLYYFDSNYGEYKIKSNLVSGALKEIVGRFIKKGYNEVSVHAVT